MIYKNFLDSRICDTAAKAMADAKIIGTDHRMVQTTKTDKQVTNDTTVSFSLFHNRIHKYLLDKVCKVFEKDLLPTYNYSRIYTKGCQLDVHTDRPACEYSVTINFKNNPTDKSWPFYAQSVNKDSFVEYNMSPGDAVFYLGLEQEHYREPLEFDECYQAFFHFVDKNGVHANQKCMI